MSQPLPAMPRQIPYIIVNEACERFSFYGMRNILTRFVASAFYGHLATKEAEAAGSEVFHIFVMGVYFFPLLGGWLSDRFFGKYRTVLWFSIIYCAGHACLAAFEHSKAGFFAGLFLIAFGSGGIKPLVASFVGDQFDQSTKVLSKKVFDAFYWSINLGSFFASLLMPIFLREYGASVAFGIPGILMAIATLVFWMGRRRYVHVPPSPPNPDSFLNVVRTALTARGDGSRPGLTVAVVGSVFAVLGGVLLFLSVDKGFVVAVCLALVMVMTFGGVGTWMQLDRARGKHPDEAVEGVRAVFRLFIVFALVSVFWSLFDQKASTWVISATKMTKPSWFAPEMMQALNPALVLILIPFNNVVLYPALRRRGIELTALSRMAIGMGSTSLSWFIIATLQVFLDGGTALAITWQILPYAFLTFGEVLVSATGLEFAYSQAPPSMKGVIMSLWYLSVTVGNLWKLVANLVVRHPAVLEGIEGTGMSTDAFLMFAFATLAALATWGFRVYARRYRMVDHYRAAS